MLCDKIMGQQFSILTYLDMPIEFTTAAGSKEQLF